MNKLRRQLAAWIACCAMLFAALAPAISHATGAVRDGVWTQICSVDGTRLVKVSVADDATSHGGEQLPDHVKHCPFCATHAGPLALPPTAGFSIPLIDNVAPHPFLFFQAPQPLAIWTTAQSRAPPAAV